MSDTTRLEQFIAEGRLIRHDWTGRDEQGRITACLLAALSSEVAASENPATCPANIMPQWLAHLTPWIDDAGSIEAWPAMIRRYAAVAARWHVLSDETWRRLECTAKRIALEGVLPVADSATPAVETVLALLREAETGADVESAAWVAARAAAADAADAADAARAAAEAAAWVAAEAAAVAAAKAAARAATRAAADAVTAAADAVTAAADAVTAAEWAAAWATAESAADGAWEAAAATAADRITANILSAIEAACDEAEVKP